MSTVIDGRALANERIAAMRDFVRTLSVVPHMEVLTMEPSKPTRQFLRIKERVAKEIGIGMAVGSLFDGVEYDVLCGAVDLAIRDADGVVLQLPLPPAYPLEPLLARIPSELDPDCLGDGASRKLEQGVFDVLPPVAAAVRLLLKTYNVEVSGKRVVVVGNGRLVGRPTALWLRSVGADVVTLTKDSGDIASHTVGADVIVLGAGVSGLLKPEMLLEDGRAVILDAGTSEEGGKVVGDADPACAARASLVTPVPGGIGPIAVALLFENMLRLRFGYVPGL